MEGDQFKNISFKIKDWPSKIKLKKT
jgi:hypothetical protein